jgi:hypothetical protein
MNDTIPTPPPFFDAGKQDPGVHALIIGVGAYGAGPLSTKFKFSSLEGPAQCARDLADFLIDREDKLTRPLRTLRLLASPSQPERDRPALQNLVPATFDNIALAIKAWHKDAARSKQEVTFFYFGGHGLQRSRDNALLLPEDFLTGSKVFEKVIDLTGLRAGMAVSKAVPEIAQNQFYFIDACRDDLNDEARAAVNDDANTAPAETVPVILDTQPFGEDVRNMPIYFASASGKETFVDAANKSTLFGAKLLDCLKTGGATQVDSQWAVTISRLGGALTKWAKAQNLETVEGRNTYNTGGQILYDDTIIHRLDARPLVPCKLRFHDDISSSLKTLAIRLENSIVGDSRFPPVLKNPHETTIPAASYVISPDPAGVFSREEFWVLPPFKEVTIAHDGITEVTSTGEFS